MEGVKIISGWLAMLTRLVVVLVKAAESRRALLA
jgi:hypothetical protein